MRVNHDAWFSRRGWFTVVIDQDGNLSAIEIPDKDTKLIRALGGILFDREGYTEEVIRQHSSVSPKKSMQYKRFRLLIIPRLCECQYTGWKPYE